MEFVVFPDVAGELCIPLKTSCPFHGQDQVVHFVKSSSTPEKEKSKFLKLSILKGIIRRVIKSFSCWFIGHKLLFLVHQIPVKGKDLPSLVDTWKMEHDHEQVLEL